MRVVLGGYYSNQLGCILVKRSENGRCKERGSVADCDFSGVEYSGATATELMYRP